MQVAKLGEAEVMADAGIDDILVGYPIVGEQKLARLADLAERVAISVTVDSDEVALGLSRTARERGLTIRVLLELDTGHAPARRPARARRRELAERIAALDGHRARRASSRTRATSTRRRATTPSASA